MKTIILSCAHGEEVSGKRSPDGKHREYLWSRMIQYRIAEELEKKGVKVVLIPEKGNMKEPGLKNRVLFANQVSSPAFYFSLHNNAAGNMSQWMSARGVEIWTCVGQTKSDEYATMIYEALYNGFPNIHGNFNKNVFWRKDMTEGDVDKETNFTELMNRHPAVLLEWLFQDNKDDVALLNDDDINNKLVEILVNVLFKIANEK